MRRLYSFIVILAIGIAAGTAGSFWYSRPSETMTATAVVEPSAPAKAERKVLYYRNPMGAPDTSPVPKKDSMGMDYIPVYADEHESAGTVKVSLDKIQRTGVKTEKVEARSIAGSRAVGRVEHDETLLTIVTVRSGRLCRGPLRR
jgi:Cu(I)/Ag(I) efflux system membrane fusion protein